MCQWHMSVTQCHPCRTIGPNLSELSWTEFLNRLSMLLRICENLLGLCFRLIFWSLTLDSFQGRVSFVTFVTLWRIVTLITDPFERFMLYIICWVVVKNILFEQYVEIWIMKWFSMYYTILNSCLNESLRMFKKHNFFSRTCSNLRVSAFFMLEHVFKALKWRNILMKF